MKLSNLYLILLAMILLAIIIFSPAPQQKEAMCENPFGLARW